ncbi:MAG: hypothetical protein KC931_12955, partial [Candidatus Omnitrophica bacterium]|nr:hypothetical protein [Candidatus Omnitrophota bacterium]
MSSPILFYLLMTVFLGLTVVAATYSGILALLCGLVVLTGVSVFIDKKTKGDEWLGIWVEFLFYFSLTFSVIVSFWWSGLIEYRDGVLSAFIKMFFLSIFPAGWAMMVVRADYHFTGAVRDIFTRTLPDNKDLPPQTLSEAFALGRPLHVKRALKENPHLMNERGDWGETPLHWMAQVDDW